MTARPTAPEFDLFPTPDSDQLATHAAGPAGQLPLSDDILRTWSSGDLFGLTQSAGMGWDPRKLLGDQYLILSTQGGVRDPQGQPIALGYHTGHWEVGLLVNAAARARLKQPVVFHLPPSAVIPAMDALKALRACSIACLIAMMPRL